ncbi:Hcy-binding domain-containing protein [Mycena kentingensis (nom. inval.)]|nr:Hcy-binding domain-containing protein [Mycena kentingensis (nom. inval.)]
MLVSGHNDLSVLDGGLGTTLETAFGLDISNTPLWSAKAAIEHPDTIIAAHLAFLHAGAQIILTSTYQCSPETFRKAGYTDNEGRGLTLKCVELAVEARRQLPTAAGEGAEPKIALSLGPYGAGLSPAQEFDGFYPPPYGPRAYNPDGLNLNAFADIDLEEGAIEALAGYHLSRVQAVSEAWDALDLVAFETIPLLREIHAIRRAMGRLAIPPKPWWISLVLPEGRFPQRRHPDADDRISVAQIVEATFALPTASTPAPSAIGVNCTQVEALPGILAQMEGALPNGLRPWLVLYPNAGDVYDSATQSWVPKAGSRDDWVAQVATIARDARGRGVWGGVVVGGCCRTGPEDIRLLAEAVRRRGGEGLS